MATHSNQKVIKGYTLNFLLHHTVSLFLFILQTDLVKDTVVQFHIPMTIRDRYVRESEQEPISNGNKGNQLMGMEFTMNLECTPKANNITGKLYSKNAKSSIQRKG